MLKCNFVFGGMCLLTFSHDAVQILASPESIAGGAPNRKTGELILISVAEHFPQFRGNWKWLSLQSVRVLDCILRRLPPAH